MGLMDRDYMKRTPEERAVGSEEYKKHQARQREMYALFAKGENLTSKERKRLEQIYAENRRYILQKEGAKQQASYTQKKRTKKPLEALILQGFRDVRILWHMVSFRIVT